jgi:hypothetical protein
MFLLGSGSIESHQEPRPVLEAPEEQRERGGISRIHRRSRLARTPLLRAVLTCLSISTPPSSSAEGKKHKCLRRELVLAVLLTPGVQRCPALCRLERSR